MRKLRFSKETAAGQHPPRSEWGLTPGHAPTPGSLWSCVPLALPGKRGKVSLALELSTQGSLYCNGLEHSMLIKISWEAFTLKNKKKQQKQILFGNISNTPK